MWTRRFSTLLCLSWVIAMAGCYSSQDKWTAMRPKVYKTNGVVRMDGKPLPEAIVVFSPVGGKVSGTAITDEAGHYQMTTFEDHDGVTEGEFQVSVEKIDWIPVGPEKAESADGGNYRRPLKEVRQTPKVYSQLEKSGLTAMVSPDGPNTFDFDLDSKAD
ncbi:carboxypeptidase-like regulatory domain-containing protein [Bremerella alba]|uniref:Carboxypeptidase regulatory-like domain-containing protein n=1 Tax=Bremerella alba TaxID=980252 RepID=A0A7V8V3L9_9BACT|nr:carboxypeptidase-like regulatory domain-containing protein [Bremerella alba]MBA2114161.1 hypothetical protein [Bremerella alba]